MKATFSQVRHPSHPGRGCGSLTCHMTNFEQSDWLRSPNLTNIMIEYLIDKGYDAKIHSCLQLRIIYLLNFTGWVGYEETFFSIWAIYLTSMANKDTGYHNPNLSNLSFQEIACLKTYEWLKKTLYTNFGIAYKK